MNKICILFFILSAYFSISKASDSLNCDDYYWGTQGEPDFKKALTCYEGSKNFTMAALLTANGQGTLSNPRKARELLSKTKPSCDHCTGDAEELKKLIDMCSQSKSCSQKPIMFYNIAMSTSDMQLSAGNDSARTKFLSKKQVDALANGLSEKAKVLIKSLWSTFEDYCSAESWWRHRDSRGGTIRYQLAISTCEDMEKEFSDKLVDQLKNKQIDRNSGADFSKLDNKLNKIYKAKTLKGDKEDKDELRTTQRKWIKFRDRWADFDLEFFKDQANSDQITSARKANLTRERIEELSKKSEYGI